MLNGSNIHIGIRHTITRFRHVFSHGPFDAPIDIEATSVRLLMLSEVLLFSLLLSHRFTALNKRCFRAFSFLLLKLFDPPDPVGPDPPATSFYKACNTRFPLVSSVSANAALAGRSNGYERIQRFFRFTASFVAGSHITTHPSSSRYRTISYGKTIVFQTSDLAQHFLSKEETRPELMSYHNDDDEEKSEDDEENKRTMNV